MHFSIVLNWNFNPYNQCVNKLNPSSLQEGFANAYDHSCADFGEFSWYCDKTLFIAQNNQETMQSIK